MFFLFLFQGSLIDDLEEQCDEMLYEVINLLKPKVLVGIGRYAENRCHIIKKKNALDVTVLYLLHPSPRASKKSEWHKRAMDFLQNNHLIELFGANE